MGGLESGELMEFSNIDNFMGGVKHDQPCLLNIHFCTPKCISHHHYFFPDIDKKCRLQEVLTNRFSQEMHSRMKEGKTKLVLLMFLYFLLVTANPFLCNITSYFNDEAVSLTQMSTIQIYCQKIENT